VGRRPDIRLRPELRVVEADWRRLLKDLICQIRAGDFRDDEGHRLTMNVHYAEAARALNLHEEGT